MDDAEKIEQLRVMLCRMMEWARELPSQYLDGDPDVRKQFASDMEEARELLKVTS